MLPESSAQVEDGVEDLPQVRRSKRGRCQLLSGSGEGYDQAAPAPGSAGHSQGEARKSLGYLWPVLIGFEELRWYSLQGETGLHFLEETIDIGPIQDVSLRKRTEVLTCP